MRFPSLPNWFQLNASRIGFQNPNQTTRSMWHFFGLISSNKIDATFEIFNSTFARIVLGLADITSLIYHDLLQFGSTSFLVCCESICKTIYPDFAIQMRFACNIQKLSSSFAPLEAIPCEYFQPALEEQCVTPTTSKHRHFEKASPWDGSFGIKRNGCPFVLVLQVWCYLATCSH